MGTRRGPGGPQAEGRPRKEPNRDLGLRPLPQESKVLSRKPPGLWCLFWRPSYDSSVRSPRPERGFHRPHRRSGPVTRASCPAMVSVGRVKVPERHRLPRPPLAAPPFPSRSQPLPSPWSLLLARLYAGQPSAGCALCFAQTLVTVWGCLFFFCFPSGLLCHRQHPSIASIPRTSSSPRTEALLPLNTNSSPPPPHLHSASGTRITSCLWIRLF